MTQKYNPIFTPVFRTFAGDVMEAPYQEAADPDPASQLLPEEIHMDTPEDLSFLADVTNPFAWLSYVAYEAVRGLNVVKWNDRTMKEWADAPEDIRKYVDMTVHFYNRNRAISAEACHDLVLGQGGISIFPAYHKLSMKTKDQVNFLRTVIVEFLNIWQDQ